MKKQLIITLLVAFATVLSANGQSIAVHSTTGKQIFKGNTALAQAYSAAQNGDTLYLSGGTFTPPAYFDKQLKIIGAGHYINSTLATGKTFIYGDITLNENADLFYMEGVEVTGAFTITNNHSVNNVTIKRCKINGLFNAPGSLTTPSTNLALLETIFANAIYLNNAQSVIISNCIVQANIAWSYGNTITNNIILFPSQWALHDCNNNQINNNIFLAYYISQGAGNIYRNNLFAEATTSLGPTATSINNYSGIGHGNIFENQTGYAFNYEHDYHLKTPLTYTGTDGTQVGLYGGTFSFKENAVPGNPQIQSKNIAAQTDANGTLQIQIQVGAQNN